MSLSGLFGKGELISCSSWWIRNLFLVLCLQIETDTADEIVRRGIEMWHRNGAKLTPSSSRASPAVYNERSPTPNLTDNTTSSSHATWYYYVWNSWHVKSWVLFQDWNNHFHLGSQTEYKVVSRRIWNCWLQRFVLPGVVKSSMCWVFEELRCTL